MLIKNPIWPPSQDIEWIRTWQNKEKYLFSATTHSIEPKLAWIIMGSLCWLTIQYSHCREKLWTLCRKYFTTIHSWKYRTIGNKTWVGMFLGRSLISYQSWPSLCKKKVNKPLSRPLCFWKTWPKMFTYDISFDDIGNNNSKHVDIWRVLIKCQ